MKIFFFSLVLGIGIHSHSAVLKAPAPLSCPDAFDLGIQALKKGQSPLLPDARSCPIEHKTIAWLQYSRSPDQFEDIVQFIQENPEWPDQNKVRESAEQSITSATSSSKVISYFEQYPPLTSKGALIYAERLWKTKSPKIASPKIQALWVKTDFKPQDEKIFYRQFRGCLTPEDNHNRLDRLILDGNYYGLKQMKPYISKKGREVVDYAIDLIQKKSRFKLSWAGVPSAYKQYPGLTVQYLKWLLSKKQEEEALRTFHEGAQTGAFKDHPDLLLKYRNYFSRSFLHTQNFQSSYDISLKYPIDPTTLKAKVDYTEGEWLIAWLELRKLNKPESAAKRFEDLYNMVTTPLSRAKMAYWSGRSHEAQKNDTDATEWYEKAAAFPHTYYGQIALRKLKRPLVLTIKKDPEPLDLKANETLLIQALKLMNPYGFENEKEKILMHLAKTGQEKIGELLVELTHQMNMPHLAVIVAKFSSQKSAVLTEKAYPILSLSKDVLDHPFIDEVILHSVIRQESNFNARSISTAGARGFMQLMQTTAEKVAKKLGIHFHWKELTQKPQKNIALGSAYLSTVLQRFKGQYILALAGYNAGPEKPEEWLKTYGPLPRDEEDLIDWIECIPYGETRGYVQRITETLPIYATRLDQKSLHRFGR